MSDLPVISVIVNCYNGEKFLNKSIKSIINQSFKKFEIIFWNNKSSDNSLKIVKKFKDKRIRIFNSKFHTNISIARNKAIKKSRGKFICFLDVDDYWHKDKLKHQIKYFKSKEIGCAFTNFWYLKKIRNNEIIKKVNLKFEEGLTSKIIKNYQIVLSTLMVRKVLIKNVYYLFDERYHIISDFDFVLKLSLVTKFYHVNKHLTYRTWHGENESIKKRENAVWEMEDWLRKNANNFVNYQNEIIFLKNRIFYDKLNFLIKKKKFIKACVVFLKININFKLNYLINIFLWFFNQFILGKPKNDHS